MPSPREVDWLLRSGDAEETIRVTRAQRHALWRSATKSLQRTSEVAAALAATAVAALALWWFKDRSAAVLCLVVGFGAMAGIAGVRMLWIQARRSNDYRRLTALIEGAQLALLVKRGDISESEAIARIATSKAKSAPEDPERFFREG